VIQLSKPRLNQVATLSCCNVAITLIDLIVSVDRPLLTELGIQVRRFINTLHFSAGVTYPKAQCNVDFGRAFFLIGIGDSDFPLGRTVTWRFGMQRVVALWNRAKRERPFGIRPGGEEHGPVSPVRLRSTLFSFSPAILITRPHTALTGARLWNMTQESACEATEHSSKAQPITRHCRQKNSLCM